MVRLGALTRFRVSLNQRGMPSGDIIPRRRPMLNKRMKSAAYEIEDTKGDIPAVMLLMRL